MDILDMLFQRLDLLIQYPQPSPDHHRQLRAVPRLPRVPCVCVCVFVCVCVREKERESLREFVCEKEREPVCASERESER